MAEYQGQIDEPQLVTIEEVNRVLEVGRLLLSVLTPEERKELTDLIDRYSSPPLTHNRSMFSVEETSSWQKE
jgi:hypothetical protein